MCVLLPHGLCLSQAQGWVPEQEAVPASAASVDSFLLTPREFRSLVDAASAQPCCPSHSIAVA